MFQGINAGQTKSLSNKKYDGVDVGHTNYLRIHKLSFFKHLLLHRANQQEALC